MLVDGEERKSLWFEGNALHMIDQRKLPFECEIFVARNVEEVAFAIENMIVRGAPAIGVAAAYGVVLGKDLDESIERLKRTRPTANDLFYALDYMKNEIENGRDALNAAMDYEKRILRSCKKIGKYGEKLIEDGASILTHCNAGALATIDYGTALAPLREAHHRGKKFFVYVDETRPRMQGALTAWELQQEGIDYCLIADNAAGYYMSKGEIDLVIVGADRIASNGDVANKIGTYEKAVIAKENNIPFYVAAPASTVDRSIKSGMEIVIEERGEEELKEKWGCRILPDWIKVKNPAFDITPSKYITGYITDEGIKKKI